MIEIRNKDNEPFEYELFIDGCHVDARVDIGNQLYLTDTDGTDLFLSKPFSDLLPDSLWLTGFPGMLEWWEASKKNNHIIIVRDTKTKSYQLQFILLASASHWNRLWTFSDYKEEFKSIVDSLGIPGMHWEKMEPDIELAISMIEIFSSIGISFDIDAQRRIGDEIARCSEILRHIHQQTEKSLAAKLRADSVVIYFDFPIEVRVACEQYLLYFIQFLHELGIDTTAELKHDIGGILFAVTPTTAEDALDKIRLALEIYLHLPSSSIKDISSADGIEIQRLAANIHHLKGQLALASAIIQAKDATIEAQRVTIQQQARLLSGDVVLDSLKVSNDRLEAKDKEEILEGIFSITEYKGKGFELNLAEIVRRLKQLFRRE